MHRILVAAAMGACSLGALAADGHGLTVSATVLSKNTCRFAAAASTINLAVDPASSGPASASITVAIRCQGSAAIASWSLTGNSGLHASSPSALRMRHATLAEYLPYSLALPATGSVPKNVWHNVTLTAAVSPADFQNAAPGPYSDTVTLSLLP